MAERWAPFCSQRSPGGGQPAPMPTVAASQWFPNARCLGARHQQDVAQQETKAGRVFAALLVVGDDLGPIRPTSIERGGQAPGPLAPKALPLVQAQGRLQMKKQAGAHSPSGRVRLWGPPVGRPLPTRAACPTPGRAMYVCPKGLLDAGVSQQVGSLSPAAQGPPWPVSGVEAFAGATSWLTGHPSVWGRQRQPGGRLRVNRGHLLKGLCAEGWASSRAHGRDGVVPGLEVGRLSPGPAVGVQGA